MGPKRILGVGLVSVDNLFVVRKGTFGDNSEAEGVSPKEKWPCRYIGSHGGGSASNTVCILSKLGFDASAFGVVGTDAGAKTAYDEFDKFNVGIDLILQKEGTTRQFSQLIFPNHHEFQSICPICYNQLPRAPSLTSHEKEAVDSVLGSVEHQDILHIDRANPFSLRLVERAYANKKLVSFDFGHYAYWGDFDLVSEIVRRTDILKTSRAAARTFLHRIGKKDFREINPNLLVSITTLGRKGAEVTYLAKGGVKSRFLPPLEPKQVVDQAGAGDAFHAGLLYALGKGGFDFSEAFVDEYAAENALSIARGFAALVCTDYGSRGYFLRKIGQENFESSVLADIEALSKGEYASSPADPDVLFAEKRNRLLSNRICGVCGQSFQKNPSTLYEAKIDTAPWSMVTSFQSGFSSKNILSTSDSPRVYLVGSGASFCVAMLGAVFLNQFTEAFAVATTPYEYVTLSKPGSSAILISFGGNNPDIVSSLKRARDIGSREIHIITGSGKSPLARETERIQNGFIHQASSKISDSGFVSTQGMLSCASVLVGFLSKSTQFESKELSGFFDIERLGNAFTLAKTDAAMTLAKSWHVFDEMGPPPHLVALGSGWSSPAVADFESKITEGAVCTIETSELKNYTHGRYLNAYRNKESRVFVIFGSPSDDRLVRFLEEKLSKDFPVISSKTSLPPPTGTLDLMIRSLYLSSEISKRINLDLAKAWRFPKESRGLFSWGPIYSPVSEKMDKFLENDPKKDPKKFQTKLS